MTKFEQQIRDAALMLIATGYYPSVPSIREQLRKTMKAHTPSAVSIQKTRKAMLEAGTFPLAGGKSAATKMANERKHKRQAEGPQKTIKAQPYQGEFAGDMKKIKKIRAALRSRSRDQGGTA
jgi:hypothetical protein